MPATISVNELRAGDVLLYHGESAVSQLIQWFSGSEYSHSSIFDGAAVVEAVAEGIVRRTIDESLAHTRYVDVWRLKKGGHVLGEPELPAAPVLDVTARYAAQGGRFSYEELLLLALLCTTRRVPLPFLRWALDAAASLLNDLIDEEREPMVCSELVFRCFSEAGPEYSPRIRGVDLRAKLEYLHLPGQPKRSMSAADREVAAFLDKYAAAKRIRSRDELLLAAVEADPNFVTPADLKRSPDFTKFGRLQHPT
ncbi:MAG: hypothetical protein HGB29_00175 [Chlorobiaceae bacterium]|nr:hypothetical protein [Chlorobiaceae bacterium]NTW73262.1 hypothetical protein [Chlorobiaceae bacterium]